jgi:hypothetical protein
MVLITTTREGHMIGLARGTMATTVELQEQLAEGSNPFVSVDHELYEVLSVVFTSAGYANVTLAPHHGEDWVLEVGKADYEEPMWEVEGQS